MTVCPGISKVSIPLMMLLLSACNSPSYLVSTLNTTSNPYIPAPTKTKKDPVIMESYAGIQFTQTLKSSSLYVEDYATYGVAQIAQAYAFGNIRAAYSGSLALGSFHVGYIKSIWYDSVDQYRVKKWRQ